MGYHSIVCVKQVPDTANITADAMKDNGTVNRAALPAIFNPEDLHALEAAVAASSGNQLSPQAVADAVEGDHQGLGKAAARRDCAC